MSAIANTPRFDLDRLREATRGGSRRFWASLEELLDEEGFRETLAAEFPAAASMFDDPGRRQFLKLMGASLLLGGLTGCSGETRSDHALPYVNQPEGMTPGIARLYATAVLFEGYAQPVIATTYDGRPTKLDGNPEHPAALGASDAFMQAAIFGLYDPERSKLPLRDGAPSTWEAFAKDLLALRARWRERQGEGLRVLTGGVTSPTLIRQMHDLAAQFPKMRWHRYEPVGADLQDEATKIALGQVVTPHYQLDQCDVIVSLGHDLLGPGPLQVRHAGLWAKRRGEVAPGQGRGRLHVAEPAPSLTGTVASTRLPCDALRMAQLAQAFGAQFEVSGWATPELTEVEKRWVDRAVNELRDHAGRSLFMIGPQLDSGWQSLAPLINERLGNAGKTVWYSEAIALPAGDEESLQALMSDVESGAVNTLVMLDCNPAYAAPAALDFAGHLASIPNRIHAGPHADETAQLCQWHLPLSHSLESFGDARAVDGSATLMQPVVAPLYASRSIHQVADMLLGTADPAADSAVRTTWRATFGNDFDARWVRALHDGIVADTQAKPLTLAARAPALPEAVRAADSELNVMFHPDPTIWDGRFANIAWLQELPKPLSKITWDNVIGISPAVAAVHKLSNGDMAEMQAVASALAEARDRP